MSAPASRIAATFARLQQEGRKALIPYMTAGFPYVDITPALMQGMVDAGADVADAGADVADAGADVADAADASDAPPIPPLDPAGANFRTELTGATFVLDAVTGAEITAGRTPFTQRWNALYDQRRGAEERGRRQIGDEPRRHARAKPRRAALESEADHDGARPIGEGRQAREKEAPRISGR